MSVYRWGVLGEGSGLLGIVRALRVLPNGVCQSLAMKGQALPTHERAIFTSFYTEYEDLLLDTSTDCVYVLGDIQTRAAWIRACLKYKKRAVVSAWPMSLSEKEIKDLFVLAKSNGSVLMEDFSMSYYPSMRRIRRLVSEEGIGRLWGLQADASIALGFSPQSSFYDQTEGGLFFHHGRYPIYLASTLLGEPKEVKGSALRGANQVVEQYNLFLDYGGGRSAYLSASSRAYGSEEAHLYGTRSRIHMQAPFYYEGLFTLYTERRRSGLIKLPPPPEGAPQRYLFDEVHHCIENKKTTSDLRTQNDICTMVRTFAHCRTQPTYYDDKS